MTIEGIPDGWELDGIRQAEPSEPILDDGGNVAFFGGKTKSRRVFLILKKIEKHKQYRPFANGDEFLSHPLNGGWIRLSSISFTKVSQFDDARFWASNEEQCYTWEEGFDLLKFRDGTPFGIEVTE